MPINNTPNPPIFILSCERSGSSLLRYIVDTHPDICCPGQLYLGALCQSLYNAAYYTLGQLPGNPKEADKKRISIAETRRTVDGLMERYATAKNKRRWCEKTTLNIDHIALLDEIFPDAQYICLYRNCLDVVHSCIKFNPWGFMPELTPYVRRHPENLVTAMAENWLDKNRKLLALEAAYPSRCFRLGYEALVADPTGVLADLFGFLGAAWDETLVEKVFATRHDFGYGDFKVLFSRGINRDSIGNGGAIPLSVLPSELETAIEALHRELGLPAIAARASKPAQSGDGLDLHRFFTDGLSEIVRCHPDPSTLPEGACRFAIHGEGGGVWSLRRVGPDIHVGRDTADPVDCTVSAPVQTFREVLDGRLAPVAAYEQRQLLVEGDAEKALGFARFLLSR